MITFCIMFHKFLKGRGGMLSHFSCIQLFVILWTVACQASLSMGFSRQEYWSGLSCPPLQGMTQGSSPCILCLLHYQADSLPLAPPGKPCEMMCVCVCLSRIACMSINSDLLIMLFKRVIASFFSSLFCKF